MIWVGSACSNSLPARGRDSIHQSKLLQALSNLASPPNLCPIEEVPEGSPDTGQERKGAIICAASLLNPTLAGITRRKALQSSGLSGPKGPECPKLHLPRTLGSCCSSLSLSTQGLAPHSGSTVTLWSPQGPSAATEALRSLQQHGRDTRWAPLPRASRTGKQHYPAGCRFGTQPTLCGCTDSMGKY